MGRPALSRKWPAEKGMAYVYIIHSPENKYYVGTTARCLDAYLKEKRKHSFLCPEKKNRLFEALRQFPLDSFQIEPLVQCTVDERFVLEKLWITVLDSRNPAIGYNMCQGGSGGWDGMHHKKESVQKMVSHPNRRHGFKTKAECERHSQRMSGAKNPMFGRSDLAKKAWETRRANQCQPH